MKTIIMTDEEYAAMSAEYTNIAQTLQDAVTGITQDIDAMEQESAMEGKAAQAIIAFGLKIRYHLKTEIQQLITSLTKETDSFAADIAAIDP